MDVFSVPKKARASAACRLVKVCFLRGGRPRNAPGGRRLPDYTCSVVVAGADLRAHARIPTPKRLARTCDDQARSAEQGPERCHLRERRKIVRVAYMATKLVGAILLIARVRGSGALPSGGGGGAAGAAGGGDYPTYGKGCVGGRRVGYGAACSRKRVWDRRVKFVLPSPRRGHRTSDGGPA